MNRGGGIDSVTAGCSCCGGPFNQATGYRGRGLSNEGSSGGGAGACHGGGGAVGGHFDWDGVTKCSNSCGHPGQPGDGSPECSRAGSWSQRGGTYGDAAVKQGRLTFGSGGGGGNAHSPTERENNAGGQGGGIILLDGGEEVKVNSKVEADGCQGWPIEGTWLYNSWRAPTCKMAAGALALAVQST